MVGVRGYFVNPGPKLCGQPELPVNILHSGKQGFLLNLPCDQVSQGKAGIIRVGFIGEKSNPSVDLLSLV